MTLPFFIFTSSRNWVSEGPHYYPDPLFLFKYLHLNSFTYGHLKDRNFEFRPDKKRLIMTIKIAIF